MKGFLERPDSFKNTHMNGRRPNAEPIPLRMKKDISDACGDATEPPCWRSVPCCEPGQRGTAECHRNQLFAEREQNFRHAIKFIDVPEGLAERIIQWNSTYSVRFGVRPRGRMNSFVGWRSVHSEDCEPVKGGIASRPMPMLKRWKRPPLRSSRNSATTGRPMSRPFGRSRERMRPRDMSHHCNCNGIDRGFSYEKSRNEDAVMEPRLV